eukprot:m.259715 g.259715  ORF g.259715 m.259715 type:complete len:170 (-) comp54586_c0_seq15:258-767(-)
MFLSALHMQQARQAICAGEDYTVQAVPDRKTTYLGLQIRWHSQADINSGFVHLVPAEFPTRTIPLLDLRRVGPQVFPRRMKVTGGNGSAIRYFDYPVTHPRVQAEKLEFIEIEPVLQGRIEQVIIERFVNQLIEAVDALISVNFLPSVCSPHSGSCRDASCTSVWTCSF